jgi:hypothetical protein
MLAISNYSAVTLLPPREAKDPSKKAPPRRVVIDGSTYVSVWADALPALREVVRARQPIPVIARSRAWTSDDGRALSVVDLQFAGGMSLGDAETEGETLA